MAYLSLRLEKLCSILESGRTPGNLLASDPSTSTAQNSDDDNGKQRVDEYEDESLQLVCDEVSRCAPRHSSFALCQFIARLLCSLVRCCQECGSCKCHLRPRFPSRPSIRDTQKNVDQRTQEGKRKRDRWKSVEENEERRRMTSKIDHEEAMDDEDQAERTALAKKKRYCARSVAAIITACKKYYDHGHRNRYIQIDTDRYG